LNQGVFQVLSTNGNTRLGGDDIDRRIIDFLLDKIQAAAARPFPLPSSIPGGQHEQLAHACPHSRKSPNWPKSDLL